jgi:hypothetical protein
MEISLFRCVFRSVNARRMYRKECTRWFKYDRDYLCVNKSQFVPVIFEPPCTLVGTKKKTNCYNQDNANEVSKL